MSTKQNYKTIVKGFSNIFFLTSNKISLKACERGTKSPLKIRQIAIIKKQPFPFEGDNETQ